MEEIVTKADWKLFRERLPGWQERFMEKLVNEYSKMLSAVLPRKTSFIYATDLHQVIYRNSFGRNAFRLNSLYMVSEK